MKKCPAGCGSTRYENGHCKKCGFTNKKFDDDYVTDIEDKKQEKRYKTGGSQRAR